MQGRVKAWPTWSVERIAEAPVVDFRLDPHYFAGPFNVDGFMRIVSKAR